MRNDIRKTECLGKRGKEWIEQSNPTMFGCCSSFKMLISRIAVLGTPSSCFEAECNWKFQSIPQFQGESSSERWSFLFVCLRPCKRHRRFPLLATNRNKNHENKGRPPIFSSFLYRSCASVVECARELCDIVCSLDLRHEGSNFLSWKNVTNGEQEKWTLNVQTWMNLPHSTQTIQKLPSSDTGKETLHSSPSRALPTFSFFFSQADWSWTVSLMHIHETCGNASIKQFDLLWFPSIATCADVQSPKKMAKYLVLKKSAKNCCSSTPKVHPKKMWQLIKKS